MLKEIDKQAKRCQRTIPVLLQVHVAKEETKFGFTPEELLQFMESGVWQQYTNVCLAGLMCMATNTDDETLIASEFEQARGLFLKIGNLCSSEPFQRTLEHVQWKECSWGMSDDYPIAVKHGSTMVRIGSLIFGERVY